MEATLFNIMIIAMLAVTIVLLIITRARKSSSSDSTTDFERLFNKMTDAGKEEIAKQFASGATEEFRRFSEFSQAMQQTLGQNRTELNEQLTGFSSVTQATLQSGREETNQALRLMHQQLTGTLESKMKDLQESNEKRLLAMQGVVDEKLQKTLETRLTQSFEMVSKQLESVQEGLGEMKTLAADAKSLKNALTNVKDRGTYGEVRLERLLEDILAPSQYEANALIDDNKRVEFVIKLPGDGETPVLLPIDSKFPIEDYNRLLDAEDKASIDAARKSLYAKMRVFAKDIHDKYILPPKTTDFALMFLPTEGLYAEVVQNAALFEELRDKFKITVVGVTTLSAFLNSLSMGFKTLAIQERSQEVWDTLRTVKLEFVKFEGILDKAHKQLRTADKTMESLVTTRTRALNRALRGVETSLETEETVKIDFTDYGEDSE